MFVCFCFAVFCLVFFYQEFSSLLYSFVIFLHSLFNHDTMCTIKMNSARLFLSWVCVCVRRALGWCTLGGRTKTWKISTAISTCSNVKQHLNLGFVTLHYTIRFLLLSSYHIPSPRKILAFFSLLSSLLILIQREPRWQLIFRSLFSLPPFLSLCLSSAHW